MYQVLVNPSVYPLNKIGLRFYLWFKTTALIAAISAGLYTWVISMTPYENMVHTLGYFIIFVINFLIQHFYCLF